MSVEGGSMSGGGSGGGPGGGGLGSGGIGSVAGIGPSVSVGIEGSGLTGAGVSPGGFRGFGEFGDLGQFKVLGPSAFGPEATVLSSPIVNEGPVGRSFLENSVPLQLGGSTEINFSSVSATEPLSSQAAIAEAENIISQARKQPTAKPNPFMPIYDSYLYDLPARQMVPAAITTLGLVTEPLLVPGLEAGTEKLSKTKAVLAPTVETKPAVSTAPAVLTQTLKEQEVEEVVEEVIQKEAAEVEEEELKRIKRKHVVDWKALKQLIKEFKEAVVKAKNLAVRWRIKLTGKLINRFIPGQNKDNESEAVKGKGPDGSIIERKDTINSLGEFSSEDQAEKRVINEAYDKPPIKIRADGQAVKDEDVARVYRPHLTKPKVIVEVVISRRKKKEMVTKPAGEILNIPAQPAVSETGIEDYPELSEVFQKVV